MSRGIIITDNKPHERQNKKYPDYAKAFKVQIKLQVFGGNNEPSMHGLLNPVVMFQRYILGADINLAVIMQSLY